MPKIKGIKERIHQPLLGTLPSKIFAEDGSYLKGLRLMVLEGPHAGKIGTVESHHSGSSIQLMVDDYGLILARKQEVRPLTEDEMSLSDKIKADVARKKEAAAAIHDFKVGDLVCVHLPNKGNTYNGIQGRVLNVPPVGGSSMISIKVEVGNEGNPTAEYRGRIISFSFHGLKKISAFVPVTGFQAYPGFEAAPQTFKAGDRVIGNEKSTHYKDRTGIVKSLPTETYDRVLVLFDGQMYCTPMPLEAISPAYVGPIMIDGLKTRDVHGPVVTAYTSAKRVTLNTAPTCSCKHHGRKIEGFAHTPISEPMCREASTATWIKMEAENRQRSEDRLRALVRSTHREWPTCPHGEVRAVVDAKTNTGKFVCTCGGRGGEK